MARLKIVGVMGSGDDPHTARAAEVGRWLAQEGVHLLTGAGGGVMTAVAEAFHGTPGRRGLVIGVVPSDAPGSTKPRAGYPNAWVEIPIFTHLPWSGENGTHPFSRNHINVLTSDFVILLPGGAGTASEAALAVNYRRPVAAYVGARAEIPNLPAAVPAVSSFDELQRLVRTALG
jgi:uncharacterized protein (TIGR00725 family)